MDSDLKAAELFYILKDINSDLPHQLLDRLASTAAASVHIQSTPVFPILTSLLEGELVAL
jgi:hypothetical protein